MKVIKNINNNVAICVDDSGNELVAFASGIGFKKPPYEIRDLKMIQRTYYNVDPRYISLIETIAPEIIEISSGVIDYARSRLNTLLSSNIVFTLADHIEFAIERAGENCIFNFSMTHNLDTFYPVEVDVGRYCLRLLKRKLSVTLPDEEIYGIALHIINAEHSDQSVNDKKADRLIIEDITCIIEDYFQMTINRSGFNYSRFVSHMEYLIERGKNQVLLEDGNVAVLQEMKKEFPEEYCCAQEMYQYFENKYQWKLGEEEILYLMMHINRLCERETHSK
ncbi:MAG: PRD domain-containing protein [Lachnospiraceae bacterium]|nr:PRD domain-containing protein [Lachnospiraceae bacterium]